MRSFQAELEQCSAAGEIWRVPTRGPSHGERSALTCRAEAHHEKEKERVRWIYNTRQNESVIAKRNAAQ